MQRYALIVTLVHTERTMVSQNLRTHELLVMLTTKEVALNSLKEQKTTETPKSFYRSPTDSHDTRK